MTSGFVSLPPAQDADPPASPAPDVVAGDGWWPDIDLSALREAARLDTTVPPARLREAAALAMIEVGSQLAAWRAPLELAGAANLQAVPAPQVDGRSQLVLLYSRAVYSTVAADLAERLRDANATAAGLDRAQELLCPADDHRRNARWAVADIQGLRRATVELI